MIRFWNYGMTGCLLAVLTCCGNVVMAADRVTIEEKPEGVVVKIDGADFTVFHREEALPKPYFWPLRAPDGTILTRPIDPNEKEHPHHRGMWASVDEVNEIKFWAERGKIVTKDAKWQSGDPGVFHLSNDWVGRDGTVALTEKTTISIYPNRLVTYDMTLAPPAGKTARFDDTKEGFFGIRIAQSMREREGGTVFNSEGKKTTKDAWGQTARWVDYTGKVGDNSYGVTIMDHPENFRPSRYHVRDYGLFSVSPFGEGAYQNDAKKAQPVILDKDRPSLRIRYALYIHQGPATESQLSAVYDQYVQLGKPLSAVSNGGGVNAAAPCATACCSAAQYQTVQWQYQCCQKGWQRRHLFSGRCCRRN